MTKAKVSSVSPGAQIIDLFNQLSREDAVALLNSLSKDIAYKLTADREKVFQERDRLEKILESFLSHSPEAKVKEAWEQVSKKLTKP